MKKTLLGLLPIALLAIPVTLFLASGRALPFGSATLIGERPPIEELSIQRVRLDPDLITLTVFNDGPAPVEIRQVLVNGGYWAFALEPDEAISRMRSARVIIEYPWNTGDDQHITLVTATGATFGTTVPAAVESPSLDWRFAGLLALIGVFIGVVPVFLGLLWFPFVRGLKTAWYSFFMALTIGLLIFLGVDSIQEAVHLAGSVPDSLDGIGVLLLGFSLSFFLLLYLSRGRRRPEDGLSDERKRRLIATTAALGIGVHNLGEGLAVGSAFALGDIALGATLIVGFMIHNITEGIPIVAPLAKEKVSVTRLALLGLLAGAPAIAGAWIGGYAYSPVWSVFFLGIGAGAIFQVVVEVVAYVGRRSLNDLFTAHAAGGLLVGLAVMYGTGLVIAG